MITWSDTKLEIALECMRKFYYTYIGHAPQLLPGYMAAGLYVHAGCRSYLNPEQERPHFQSAKTYASRRTGTWKRFVAAPGTYGGRQIDETFPGEVWALAESVVRPCSEHFYALFSRKKPPLAVERGFRFRVGQYVFSGAFDVITSPLSYLDFKTSSKEREIRPQELQHDYQFTIYSAILPLLALHDPVLGERLTRRQRKALKENPFALMEDVKGSLVQLRTSKTYEVRRRPHDFLEMLNTVEALALRAEQGDFSHSRGIHCSFCLVRKTCEQDTLEGKVLARKVAVNNGHGVLLYPPRRELEVLTEMPTVSLLDYHRRKKRLPPSGQQEFFTVTSS
jgi:hypothetical protein